MPENKQKNKNRDRGNRTKKKQEPKVVNEFSSFSNATMITDYDHCFTIFDLYDSDDLMKMVRDPMGNNKLLREISRILYGTDGTYTNTVDYMTAMPTLDRVIVPHGTNKKKAARNKRLMESTLRTIKDKELIRDGLWRGMIDGIAFYYFETTNKRPELKNVYTDWEIDRIIEINDIGINASVIPLPTDYTEIVGRRNNTYVVAFNLNYFKDFPGEAEEEKLKKMPKEIRDAYHKRKTENGFRGGTWVRLDESRTIVHKIRSEIREKYGRPLVLAAIRDILYDDYFTNTKRNVLDDMNNRIIYETFPEGRDKGTCALTQKQQKEQHDTVKNATLNKNNRGGMSFFSVAAGTKINQLDIGDSDIFDSKYEEKLVDKIAGALGFAGSAINGVGSGSYSGQQTNLELVTAQIFQWIDQLSAELNKCISKCIIRDNNNWVEVKYLPITYVNKGSMVGYAKDLYLQGKGSLSLWAAACGVPSDVFFALLDQELEEDIENKYPVHKTSYTVSSNDDAGRPETDNPTENTIKSRANNGNAIPTPSDKK